MTSWPAVSLTGHRPQHLPPDTHAWVRTELDRIVAKLRTDHGLTAGISGMALGSDLWWADSLVRAGIPLHAHVPFPQQPDPWKPADRAEWHRLIGLATTVTTYGDAYDVKLLHARNDGMLDASTGGAVVAVWRRSKSTGGTASAVRKAVARGLPVIHIDPDSRTVTLQEPARV